MLAFASNVHVDVGGGSDLNGTQHALAHIALRWMIKEILISPDGAGIVWNEDHPLFGELGVVLHPASGSMLKSSNSDGSQSFEAEDSSRSDLQPHGREIPGAADLTDHLVNKNTSTEPDDAPSPYLPVNARPEDVVSPMHDKLKTSPAWWLLEFLPFITSKQDENDQWENNVRYVCDLFP